LARIHPTLTGAGCPGDEAADGPPFHKVRKKPPLTLQYFDDFFAFSLEEKNDSTVKDAVDHLVNANQAGVGWRENMLLDQELSGLGEQRGPLLQAAELLEEELL